MNKDICILYIYIYIYCDFNNLPLGYMEKSSCPLSSVAQRGLGGIRTIYGWPFRGKGRAGRHQSQGLFHQWILGEDTPFSTLVVVQPFFTVGNRGFLQELQGSLHHPGLWYHWLSSRFLSHYGIYIGSGAPTLPLVSGHNSF